MVNINGETWRIFLVSPNHPALQRTNGQFAPGSCDDVMKAIFINQNVSDNFFKKILCHELVHAYLYSNNIGINNYYEEILADLIATYGEDIVNITNEIFENKKRGSLY